LKFILNSFSINIKWHWRRNCPHIIMSLWKGKLSTFWGNWVCFVYFVVSLGFTIFGIWELFDHVQFLQLMLLLESYYFVKPFMPDDLFHVGWYLFHSCFQSHQFRMQNHTCSCDQKAQRFCALFSGIIQFMTWVINMFKLPFTTPPVFFCIIENISVLILHIILRYLKIFKSQSIFLIYIIGICEDTSVFLPAMFGIASLTSLTSFCTGISRLQHCVDSSM
jgi:hypothetical protein